MKRIVVISRYYAPENKIAAVRPTKLVKYLRTLDEYSFTIITSEKSSNMEKDHLLERDISNTDQIVYIPDENIISRPMTWIIHLVKKRTQNTSTAGEISSSISGDNNRLLLKIWRDFLNKAWNLLKFLAEYQKGINYYRNTKKYLKNHQISFNIIFSTYGPYATHWIGRSIKKHEPAAFWIADFRDGPINDFVPWGFRNYTRNYPKWICRNADIVTAVSQGVLDELGLPENLKKTVIPNGYDREDVKEFPQRMTNEKMTFTYTGTLYRGKSDLTPLFHALSELMEQGRIEKSKIMLQYAGSELSRFIEQTALYHLDDIVVSYGNVEREKALRLQWESDILFLASWNQSGKTGVVTGKLLEYMMMDRPILSLISGELPNSKIREITETCKLGFCYEQANGEKDYVELKEYILEQYSEFLSTGMAAHRPNQQKVEQYNYKNIAERFTALLS